MASSSPSRARTLALAIVLFLVASASARPSQQDEPVTMVRFRRWMEQHGRSYPTVDEELRRFEVYRRNVERIEATNRAGGLGYTLGENQFTDLTSERLSRR
uniref:Fruit bromelain n=1 Tax=Aegilops tauschii TaxID=37682 RepID=N1QS19_AEGTA